MKWPWTKEPNPFVKDKVEETAEEMRGLTERSQTNIVDLLYDSILKKCRMKAAGGNQIWNVPEKWFSVITVEYRGETEWEMSPGINFARLSAMLTDRGFRVYLDNPNREDSKITAVSWAKPSPTTT